MDYTFPFDLNEAADGEAFPFDLNEAADDGFMFGLNQPADGKPEDGDIEPEEQTEHHQTTESGQHHKTRPKLNSDSRMQILVWFLENQTNGKLRRGAIQEVAAMYNVTRRIIITIWSTGMRQKAARQTYNMATNGHNSGRKRIQLQPNAITEINMGDRSCIRDLPVQLKVCASTANRMIKKGTD